MHDIQALQYKQEYNISGRKKCLLQFSLNIIGRVVLVANDVITFIDRFKQSVCVANSEQGGNATPEKMSGRRTNTGVYHLIVKLVQQLSLAFFYVGLCVRVCID